MGNDPKSTDDGDRKDPHAELDTSLVTPLANVQLSSHPSAQPRAAASQPTFAPGDLLVNRFRILRFIAKGGMGEVYEAEDLELQGDRVAIKTVLPSIANNPEAIAQFKREIQLARKVTHPNVCRIFDLVYDQRPSGAIAFLTMELLEGETVSSLIEKSGTVPLDQALELGRQMAEGLHAAHRAGVIHQDFKSGNVMIVPAKDGEGKRAVITDFGLAHNVRDAERESGNSIGTPAYMAPEQIEGKAVSPATDVYALGVVLYELLTGHWPYTARTPEELQRKKLNEAPVLPSKYAPEIPPRVERGIVRCLARAPEARFQSTLEVMDALESPRVSRKVWVGVALLLIALAGLGFYRWRAWLASRDPTVAVIGFKNNTGNAHYDWLATELSETLTAGLAGSQRIHVVPAGDVARLKSELSVAPNASLASEDATQIRTALGAKFLLSGSYSVEPASSGERINVDLNLQGPGGESVGSFRQSGSESDYQNLMTAMAAAVRQKLGATPLSSSEASELQSIYPADAEARKLYFEGLDKLRAFDAPAAEQLLSAAAQKEPSNVAIHSTLADALAQLRLDPQAAKEAQTAATLAEANPSLPLEYVVLSKARADEMNKNWQGAIDNYRLLFAKYKRLNYGLQLASAQTEGSHPQDALQTLRGLQSLPAPMNSDPRIQMAFAKTYQAMNQSAQQLQAAQAALDEAKRRGSHMMQANAQLQLCWAYRSLGKVDDAYAACNDAQNLFPAFGDKVSAAVALNDMATLRSDHGQYREAQELYDRVIAINKAAGAKKDYVGANINAARTAILEGKLNDAQDYIQNALTAAQEIGDKSDGALARVNLAEIFSEQGKLTDAEQQAQLALALGKEIPDETIQSMALDHLAEYQSEINIPQALKTYAEALKLREKNGDQRGIATTLNNMAEAMFRGGDIPEAEQRYQQSLRIFEQLKDRDAVAQNWLSLAEIDLERIQLGPAEEKALKALKEFQSAEDKSPDSEEEASSLLVKIYVAGGRAPDAVPYIKRINEIASSDRDIMFGSRLSIAEYLDATGKRAEAIQQLQSVPSEAKASGRNYIALEARLALAKLRATGPHDPALQKELAAISSAAKEAGFRSLLGKANKGFNS